MHEEWKVRKGIGKKGKESLKEEYGKERKLEYGKERKVWGKNLERMFEGKAWEVKKDLK